MAFIPYVAELSDTISGWSSNLHTLSVDSWWELKSRSTWEEVQCQVPCSCGWVYIGDTKGVPEIRLKEPKAATRRGELEKSTIDQHAWNQTGRLGWSCGVGRGGKQHYTIHKRNSLHPLIDTERLINRDEGITISDCWTAFLKLAMTSASVASSSRNQWWSMLLIKCRSQAGRSLEWSKVEAHDKGTGAAQLNFVSVN